MENTLLQHPKKLHNNLNKFEYSTKTQQDYSCEGCQMNGLGKQKIKIKKWGSQICNLTTFMLSVALLGFEK